MATTVVFIEHLITGIQAFVWIALLIVTCFGWDWIDLERLKDLGTPLGIVILAFAYPIGVGIDTVADDVVFKRKNKEIKEKKLKNKTMTAMKLLSNTDAEFLVGYLNYLRSRIRITRSAAVNFAFITVCMILFTSIRLRNMSSRSFWMLLMVEIVLGFAATGLAIFSWKQITETFAEKINQGFELNSAQAMDTVFDAGVGKQ